MTKLKIDFYADTFRNCVIEVPAEIKPQTQEARILITTLVAGELYKNGIFPEIGMQWQIENWGDERIARKPVETGKNYIKIITAKLI